jgi:GT2 family glycosyltransferase
VRHSVVVISWNAGDVLGPCIDTILDQEVTDGLELIVVDNGSTDHTPELLERYAGRIHAMRNDSNRTFSEANNQGAAVASGEFLFLFNSDTELFEPDTFGKLAKVLREPGVGLVGPRLLNPDRTLQPSCSAHPTVVRALVIALGLHRLLPDRARARLSPRGWSHSESRDVDWLLGAALGIRRELWEELGGFWSTVFAEEQDLARRVQGRGLAVRYVRDAPIVHIGNYSFGQRWSDPDRVARYAAGEVAFLREHYGRLRAITIRVIACAGLAARWLVVRALGDRERARVYASAARVFAPWAGAARSAAEGS